MWKNIAGLSKAAAAARTHGSRRCFSTAIPGPCIVHKRGADILHDPWFNKVVCFILDLLNFRVLKIDYNADGCCCYGLSISLVLLQDTGFPLTERDRLGIRGLLPPRVMTCVQQCDRFSKF